VIILPVLLLIVMAALDLGRVFMGWVVLNNAARVGANYAALHSDAWGTPGDAADRATYTDLVTQARNDASAAMTGCDTATIPDPGFPGGKDVGDPVEVILDCQFTPITPIVGDVFAGGSFTVSARSVFPVRTGMVAGAAVTPAPSCLSDFSMSSHASLVGEVVSFTDLTPAVASGWIWAFGDSHGSAIAAPTHAYETAGTYTVTMESDSNGIDCTAAVPQTIVVSDPPSPDPSASASPSVSPSIAPSPTPGCTVPSFIGKKRNTAQEIWGLPKPPGAGFTTQVQYDPNAHPSQNWDINWQSLVGGRMAPCNATVMVSPNLLPPPT
jgi:PKD repeat protein